MVVQSIANFVQVFLPELYVFGILLQLLCISNVSHESKHDNLKPENQRTKSEEHWSEPCLIISLCLSLKRVCMHLLQAILFDSSNKFDLFIVSVKDNILGYCG